MKSRSDKYAFPLAVLFFLSVTVYFYSNVITLKPRGVHSWAQSDRLALAYGFQRHGYDFLQPATLSSGCENQITGVEMPLQSYMAAIAGAVIGKSYTHTAFRLITLLLSLSAALALFRHLWQATGDFISALFPGLFISCAPVYAYYADGFLPDIAGLAFLIFGYIALLRYFRTSAFSDAVKTICWMGLAALVKMSLAFMLLGTMLFLIAMIWRKERARMPVFLLVCLLSGGLLIAQYFHIRHLNALNHCGIFLSAPRPPVGLHITEYLLALLAKYRGIYWSAPQEWIAIPVLTAILAASVTGYQRLKKRLIFLAIPLLSAMANFGVMGLQMEAHDYYALVTFFPLIIWLSILFVFSIPVFTQKKAWKFIFSGIIAIFYIAMLPTAKKSILHQTYLTGTDEWLYSPEVAEVKKRIPEDSHIVVAQQTDAPNLGLVWFERVGISTRFDFNQNGTDYFNRVRAQFFIMDKAKMTVLKTNTPDYSDYLREYYNGKDITVFEYIE